MTKKTTRSPRLTVIRDEARLGRLRRIGLTVGFVGMGVLVVGFLLGIFLPAEQILVIQGVALLLGLPMSQVGLYLINKYARNPRPDRLLDQGLGRAARHGRIYHFVLPAPHVLLTDFGVYVFVLKWQGGRIQASGDYFRQRIFFMRRIFGTESLGKPAKEAADNVRAVAGFIARQDPTLAERELPIRAVIVFTTNIRDLDLADATVPAYHYTKLRGYMRQEMERQPRLARADVEAIQTIFDAAAGQALGQSTEAEAVEEEA